MRWAAPVILALPLAACTSSGNSARTTSADDVTSARVRIGGEIARFGIFTGRGLFDFGAHRGRLIMDYSRLGGSSRMSLIQNGRLTYMEMRVGRKHWVTVRSKKELGLLGLLTGVDVADGGPTDLLELLNDRRLAGKARIRGVQTKHYKGSFVREHEDSVPAELWVDNRGVARRIRIAVPPTRESLIMTVDLFGFGVSVRPKLPPSADVISFAEVQRKWRGASIPLPWGMLK